MNVVGVKRSMNHRSALEFLTVFCNSFAFIEVCEKLLIELNRDLADMVIWVHPLPSLFLIIFSLGATFVKIED